MLPMILSIVRLYWRRSLDVHVSEKSLRNKKNQRYSRWITFKIKNYAHNLHPAFFLLHRISIYITATRSKSNSSCSLHERTSILLV